MSNDMIKRILEAKGAPFSEEEIELLSDSDGWNWIYKNNSRCKPKSRIIEICFTGFAIHETVSFESQAVSVGFNPVRTVTKNLNYLCIGPNAGLLILQKAKVQSVQVITIEGFENIIKNRNCE